MEGHVDVDGRCVPSVGQTPEGADGAALDHLCVDQVARPLLSLVADDPMRPRVGGVVQHDGPDALRLDDGASARRADGRDHPGSAVQIHRQEVVLQSGRGGSGGGCGGLGVVGGVPRARRRLEVLRRVRLTEPDDLVPQRRQVDQDQAVPVVPRRLARGDLLERNRCPSLEEGPARWMRESDGSAHLPGQRVEDHHRQRKVAREGREGSHPLHRVRSLDPGVRSHREDLGGPRRHLLGDAECLPIERSDRLERLLGAGSAERVVELVEEHPLPRFAKLALQAQRASRLPRGRSRELLGHNQPLLGPGVRGLDPGHRAVAADRVEMQVTTDHRKGPGLRGGCREVGVGGGEHDVMTGDGRHFVDRPQACRGGSTAMIADAQEEHARPAVGSSGSQQLGCVLRHDGRLERRVVRVAAASAGVVGERNPVRGQARTVHALPEEDRRREVLFVRLGPHHHVRHQPGFAEELRQ